MARIWSSASSTATAAAAANSSSTPNNNTKKQHAEHSSIRPRAASREMQSADQFLLAQELTRSPRRRINSRDIPRTYSGLYGASDDLLPFEMNRHRAGYHQSVWFLWLTYVTIVIIIQIAACAVVSDPVHNSWTVTNAIHLALSVIYIHWLKGSLYDEQGEMNALTVWEQLEATADTRSIRRCLLVVPTVLTYAACHFGDYQIEKCLINISIWSVAMTAKLPFMNGVRIFGINRTAGIDDDNDDNDNDADEQQDSCNKKSIKKKKM